MYFHKIVLLFSQVDHLSMLPFLPPFEVMSLEQSQTNNIYNLSIIYSHGYLRDQIWQSIPMNPHKEKRYTHTQMEKSTSLQKIT
jgi:hypothetical protein